MLEHKDGTHMKMDGISLFAVKSDSYRRDSSNRNTATATAVAATAIAVAFVSSKRIVYTSTSHLGTLTNKQCVGSLPKISGCEV